MSRLTWQDIAHEHVVDRVSAIVRLVCVVMRVVAIVCEVDTLAKHTEVCKANIKSFVTLVDSLGLCTVFTGTMEENLDELAW